MRLALFQPDIPQNVGAALRLGACLGVPVEIIEPCGFPFNDKGLRRAGLDYIDRARLTRHASWRAFTEMRGAASAERLVLLTTAAEHSYDEFSFETDDILLLGRESAGAPEHVHKIADARIKIPMAPGARSLNVVVAAAIALAEGLRQTGGLGALRAARPRAAEKERLAIG
jgi:tRNA (cytidine/uridine-2'-O-)-methyltransferase